MMSVDSLKYLAARLGRINDPECEAAHEIVVNAIEDFRRIDRSSIAERDLFHSVWGHLTRALDHCLYPPDDRNELDALEAEMAGRTLVLNLQLGEIKGSSFPVNSNRSWLSFFRRLGKV